MVHIASLGGQTIHLNEFERGSIYFSEYILDFICVDLNHYCLKFWNIYSIFLFITRCTSFLNFFFFFYWWQNMQKLDIWPFLLHNTIADAVKESNEVSLLCHHHSLHPWDFVCLSVCHLHRKGWSSPRIPGISWRIHRGKVSISVGATSASQCSLFCLEMILESRGKLRVRSEVPVIGRSRWFLRGGGRN